MQDDLIDLARYPIDRDGPRRDEVIAQARAALARDGCAVLKGFLTRSGIDAACAETDAVAKHGHRSFSRTNAYFTADDPGLPEDDPRRRFYDRSNAFIAADLFAADGPLRRIHDHPGFDAFPKPP